MKNESEFGFQAKREYSTAYEETADNAVTTRLIRSEKHFRRNKKSIGIARIEKKRSGYASVTGVSPKVHAEADWK